MKLPWTIAHRRTGILAGLAAFLSGLATPLAAQTVAQRTFDFELHGDDPGAVFAFDLPADLDTPLLVRFDGAFQNLVPDATGVRYDLFWIDTPGTSYTGFLGGDFMPLPASGQLPLMFEHSIDHTPTQLFLLVEGGGPSDHFRFQGDFSVQQVPEPHVVLLLGAGALLGLGRWKVNRPC